MVSGDKKVSRAVNRCGNAVLTNARNKALGVGVMQISE
jgi:hypothetical protein